MAFQGLVSAYVLRILPSSKHLVLCGVLSPKLWCLKVAEAANLQLLCERGSLPATLLIGLFRCTESNLQLPSLLLSSLQSELQVFLAKLTILFKVCLYKTFMSLRVAGGQVPSTFLVRITQIA